MSTYEKQEAAAENGSLITETYPVSGLHCASCAASVESILAHTEGVSEASVNYADHSVRIAYQKEVKPESLREAVQKIGYDLDIEKKKTN